MSPPTPAHEPLPTFGWTHQFVGALARFLARGLFSLEVRGLEHLPADEPFLICANHTSHADTFALATATGPASRRLVFLGAHDYFSRMRWRRQLLRRTICLVEFDRRRTIGATRHNLRTLGACRDDGRIVVLFPEGTRSVDGRMGVFKPGAVIFADKLNLRVVPCRIEGAHAVLRKGRWLPRLQPLRVSFGPPQSLPPAPDDESGAERGARYDAFMALIQNHVVRLGENPVESAPAYST
jgi:1-acyl-sn-glycerol-3-phosphate acyltransferase